MKTKTKVALTLGLLSLLALGGLTQSKYVRNATIEMDVTNEADVAMREGVNPDVKNTASQGSYTVKKTGYYAIQLKGGDGGTNNGGTGGKGGVVEEVYYLEKGQTVWYSLGGRGGYYQANSDNRTSGASDYSAGGTGGDSGLIGSNASSRQGGGGGGASIVRLGSSTGTDIMIAGGGGGGAGGGQQYGAVAAAQTPRQGGIGGAGVGSDNTGLDREVAGTDGLGNRNGTNKNGQSGTAFPADYHAGGGGGGGKTSGIGGAKGTSGGNYGSGSGGSSWLAGSLNGKYALNLTDHWKDIIGRPAGFALTTGRGGSQQQGGQIRIAFLWTDTEADHQAIENIYK
ncbi:glycine-rich protein [Pseudolactococcus reticulitermitis]|uniref:receptor protein-tyrosine kinase n=1 Tax=Pseudolactococcus reticulitermitis TaxID=2025039 RepID=A0A224X2G9_9LACT|nr:glycine-rich protein [Lactococcus reticulitermitis]GAX48337.1 hypothetical protein RsY01_1958 [Lactococcus reticulitermitis]